MRSVGPSRLDERRSADDVFLLDIRPEAAFERGHVPGSYNAPVYHELQRGETEALDGHLHEIPDDREVVTVCKAGVVARTATEHLDGKGYEAVTLTGGYAGWRRYETNAFSYRVVAFLRKLLP